MRWWEWRGGEEERKRKAGEVSGHEQRYRAFVECECNAVRPSLAGVCVCVWVCVRACVRARMRACICPGYSGESRAEVTELWISKALTKNQNLILNVMNFRKILSQCSGMIIFVLKRQPGGSCVEDGWEKAKGEAARSAGRLKR